MRKYLRERLGARPDRWLAALLLLGLAARFAAVAYFGFSTVRFGDAEAYIATARTLVATHTYPANVDYLPVFRAPCYPVFLAISTAGHPESVPVDKGWNVLLGVLLIPVMAAIARRALRSERAALVAAAITSVHPSFVLLSTDVQSEPLFVLLYAGAAALLLRARDEDSARRAAWAGLAMGLAVLTRPSVLALLPLGALLLFDAARPVRRRFGLLAAWIGGTVLVIAPWTVRNAIAYHAFIPVSDQAGLVLYQGNSDTNVRYYRLRSRAEYDRWNEEVAADLARGEIRRIAGSLDRNPTARSRDFQAAALSWMRAHPGLTLWLWKEKAVDWIRPWPSRWGWPMPVVIAVGVYNGALCAFAIYGLAIAPRPGVKLAALSILTVSMLVHVVMLAVWRYRITYWDPVLVLYAAYGISGGGFAVARKTQERQQ